MPALTEKLHVFRYLDGAAGFRKDRTYPLRYQVLDSGDYSIELSHVTEPDGSPRLGIGPLVLSAEEFRQWFEPVREEWKPEPNAPLSEWPLGDW